MDLDIRTAMQLRALSATWGCSEAFYSTVLMRVDTSRPIFEQMEGPSLFTRTVIIEIVVLWILNEVMLAAAVITLMKEELLARSSHPLASFCLLRNWRKIQRTTS